MIFLKKKTISNLINILEPISGPWESRQRMTVTAQQVGRTVEGWVWWVLSRTSLYTLPTMGKPRDAGWKTEIGMNHTSDLSLCTPC